MPEVQPPLPVCNADGAPGTPAARGGVLRGAVRLILSEYSVLFLALAYFLVVWALLPRIGSGPNLTNLMLNMLPLLAVALGQTVVLITGGIDLSVTSVIAAVSVLAAWVMTSLPPGVGVPLAVAAALAAGLAVGLLNGGAVTALGMPPFIVTLSTMMMLSGGVLWVTRSRNVGNLPQRFLDLGAGRVLGVPPPLLIVPLLGLAVHLLLSRTLWGYWLYAAGHNPTAARISGVPVRRVVTLAYAVSGFCAAVASLLYTARLEGGSPTMGREILLDVVGAAVIGGTSLFGGKGKVVWTVFGVLLFSLIDNTLNLLGLEYYTIMTVKGAVILAAAGLDLFRARVLVAAGGGA
jgi:ribose/xylose/arabinose/galactoside ABC-type transport system permease subunit